MKMKFKDIKEGNFFMGKGEEIYLKLFKNQLDFFGAIGVNSVCVKSIPKYPIGFLVHFDEDEEVTSMERA